MRVNWTTVESYCFLILVASAALAVVAWLTGMLRRKPFGAIPAVLWIVLVVVALACSAIIAIIAFTGAGG